MNQKVFKFIFYSQNIDTPFPPDSILKILTSLAAVDYFGMNPLFISEVIQDLCEQILAKTKAKTIHNIILDHLFFHPDIHIPETGNSLNFYDATSGALCANFNTLSFKWSPLYGGYVSAEPDPLAT